MESRAVPSSIRSIVFRVLAFQAVFILFHFAYGWFPGPVTALFSGTDESVFQHMKIGYFAWIAVSLGEFLILRPAAIGTFLSTRFFAATMGPWAYTIVWYLAPALVGRIASPAAEIAWANLVILATGNFMTKLEDLLAERKASRHFLVTSTALFAVFLYLAIRFTARVPWVDLFTPPAL